MFYQNPKKVLSNEDRLSYDIVSTKWVRGGQGRWAGPFGTTQIHHIRPDYCHLIIIYFQSSDADKQNRQDKLLQHSRVLRLFTPKGLIIWRLHSNVAPLLKPWNN